MLRDLLVISMIQSTIRMATPVLLAAMGAMVTSAAGIINISLEGTMLLSAFFAVVGSYFFSSVWMGLLIGVGTGMLVALLFGVFSLRFRAHIILMGIAINAFANAFTIYMLRSMFKVAGAFSDLRIVGFDQVHIPIIKDIPVLAHREQLRPSCTWFGFWLSSCTFSLQDTRRVHCEPLAKTRKRLNLWASNVERLSCWRFCSAACLLLWPACICRWGISPCSPRTCLPTGASWV